MRRADETFQRRKQLFDEGYLDKTAFICDDCALEDETPDTNEEIADAY